MVVVSNDQTLRNSRQAELKLVDERHGGKFGPDDDDKTEGRGIMDRLLFVLWKLCVTFRFFD